MRLQCPNCDAEYEVEDNAIPPEGRDVQCSNCGHGWFQTHPDFEIDYELESALYDPPPPLPQGGDVSGGIASRRLDPDSMRILREEVALEQEKRQQDAGVAASAAGVPGADDQKATLTAPEPDAAPDMPAGPHPSSPPPPARPDRHTPQAPVSVQDSQRPDHVDDFDIQAVLDAVELTGEPAEPEDAPKAMGADAQRDDLGGAPDLSARYGAAPNAQEAGPELSDGEHRPLPQSDLARRAVPRRVSRLRWLQIQDAQQPAAPFTGDDPLAEPLSAPGQDPAPQPSDWHDYGYVADENDAANMRADPARSPRRQRSGRRAGFYAALFLAVIGTSAYVAAPQLAALVPGLAPAIAIYVGAINALRDQVQLALPWAVQAGQQLFAALRDLLPI